MNVSYDDLVINASRGSQIHLNEIIQKLIPTISKMSESIWYLVRDQTSFEHDCYQTIAYEIQRFRPGEVPFHKYILRRLVEVRNRHLKRRRVRISSVGIESLARFDDDGELQEVCIDDVLANIENEVLLNEKVALLAEGDPRKLAVLKAWTKGCYCDSDVSLLLAQQFGGKSESHRKFVIRFRTSCQRALQESVA